MIPASLAYGEISLYNIYRVGVTGINAPSSHNFGLIDQVSMYGISLANPGQSVLYNGKDQQCVLQYLGHRYFIIRESAIIMTETP